MSELLDKLRTDSAYSMNPDQLAELKADHATAPLQYRRICMKRLASNSRVVLANAPVASGLWGCVRNAQALSKASQAFSNMKTNIIAVAGIGFLALSALAFVSIFEIRLASAQVDATSSTALSSDSSTTPLVLQESSTPIADAASSTPATTPANNSASTTFATSSPSTVEPPPRGLTLVHIVGTKYTDYFTDGIDDDSSSWRS